MDQQKESNALKTVGEILKKCIKKNGHTLEEEAKEIGVSQSLLSDFINGKREIRSESLRRICTHFNISADFLLGLSPNPKIDADLEMSYWNGFRDGIERATVNIEIECQRMREERHEER